MDQSRSKYFRARQRSLIQEIPSARTHPRKIRGTRKHHRLWIRDNHCEARAGFDGCSCFQTRIGGESSCRIEGISRKNHQTLSRRGCAASPNHVTPRGISIFRTFQLPEVSTWDASVFGGVSESRNSGIFPKTDQVLHICVVRLLGKKNDGSVYGR